MKREVDGKYSLIICVVCFIINFLCVGNAFTFCGIMLGSWRISPLCGAAPCSDFQLNLVQSLVIVNWMMLGSFFCEKAISKLGYRSTLMLGGFLMMLGTGLSFFATQIWHLYISFGCIAGLGIGLSYLPHILIAGRYFDKNRNIALALITGGNTIAGLPLPFLINGLIDNFSWNGAMLIYAGIVFHVVVFALPCILPESDATVRILSQLQATTAQKETDEPPSKESVTISKSGFQISESSQSIAGNPYGSYLQISENITESNIISQRSAKIIRDNLDPDVTSSRLTVADSMILFTESRLLPQKAKSASPEAQNPPESIFRQFKNRRFTAMFICDVVGFFSYMITFQYFIDRLINGVNLENNEAYFCMSLIAIGNTISKIVCGILCDRKIISTYGMMAWSHVLSGIMGLCINFSTDAATSLIYGALMGISIGPFSLTPCTFADLVPPEMLAPAMSLLTFWEGIALFLGPLVGGMIYDYSKSYNLVFYVGGMITLIVGVLPLIVSVNLKRFCNNKRK